MLNEFEEGQLSAMLDAYGSVGVVDGLVTILARRAQAESTLTRGVSWRHDADVLRRAIRSLWVRGPARSAAR